MMKKIGMLGGMSWESTLEYYRIINEEVKKRAGETHSAQCILYSYDFHEMEILQHRNQWDQLEEQLLMGAENIIKAGADFICICTNTMHMFAESIEKQISVPLLHIADSLGRKIAKEKLETVGLLGTKFTMEKDFYKKRIEENYGIRVVIPEIQDREEVHRIIYKELILGKIKENSKNHMKKIIGNLREKGAQGVILGCTEIPLLIKEGETDIPLFESTRIHALAAVEEAILGVF